MAARSSVLALLSAFLLACGGSPSDPNPPAPSVAVIEIGASGDLVPGQSQTLQVVARGANGNVIANPTIVWMSTNTNVATVAGIGVVTAVGPGTAEIKGAAGTVSATISISVVEGGYVGAAGGTVTALGGRVRLTIPAGALQAGTAITVKETATVPTGARLIPATAVTLEPAGISFNVPATLRLRYPAGLGSAVVIPRLRLARADGGTWQEFLPVPVDTTARLAGSAVTATGTYAVFAPAESLRGLAQMRNFVIGSEVNPQELRTDPAFAQNLAEHFSSLTPGNPMKFGPIHPNPTTYAFADADLIVDFAESWGMEIHGHVLLWHMQQPAWLTVGTPTRQSLLSALKSHIETVVGRYRGRLRTWDVANEMIATDGSGMRPSFWTTIIGPDVVDSAFVWAHRVDPDAKLYLNDFNVEFINAKSDSLLALAKRLKAAGIPIHGIGLQAHFTTGPTFTFQPIANNIARFEAEGFDVRFTELDVRMPDGMDHLQNQAAQFGAVVEACLIRPRCDTVTVWGHTDRYSWIPAAFPGFGRAHPFDSQLMPKPAFWAIRNLLAGTGADGWGAAVGGAIGAVPR